MKNPAKDYGNDIQSHSAVQLNGDAVAWFKSTWSPVDHKSRPSLNCTKSNPLARAHKRKENQTHTARLMIRVTCSGRC